MMGAGMLLWLLLPLPRSALATVEAPKLRGNLSGMSAVDGKPSKRTSAPSMSAKSLPDADFQLRISYRVRLKELRAAGNFLAQSAEQVNYILGGDVPYDVRGGKGVEFKRFGVIVNALAAVSPHKHDLVDAQLQVEISGPVKAATSSRTTGVETFQLQTRVLFHDGVEKLVVDESDRLIAIKIEVLK